MQKFKRSLTESYRKEKSGVVGLSGKWEGIDGVGKTLLIDFHTRIATKSEVITLADIVFKDIDTAAIEMAQRELGIEFVENEEGYIIDIDDTITVYADTERAKLYAVHTILDAYEGCLKKAVVYHYPIVSYRSARVYLPAKKELTYFKKFIDMLCFMGYNAIVLEIGGAMEYKRHPEINETWAAYCKSMQEFNEKPLKASKVYYRTKNAVHTYNGGGDIYTQQEMRELASYCAERFIEIIPEVPSLTHSEYFLISHPELRECQDEPFASTACPSNEGLYSLVFDLYDEVIDVFTPKTLHIGHDEWWVMCVCDQCKDKNAARLFADNVLRSYNYLKERGIRTMMWAEKLIRYKDKNGEPHGAAEKHIYNVKTDETMEVMGQQWPVYKRYWYQAPEEAMEKGFHQVIYDMGDCLHMLPEDIIYVNWCWSLDERVVDDFLLNGKHMVYGNFRPSGVADFRMRVEAGAKGYSVSNWFDSSEAGLQRYRVLFELGYGASICWGHNRPENDYVGHVHTVLDALYRFRNRDTLRGSYVEVLHTATKEWENGERYYNALPYADEPDMTMGEYRVTYEDGSCEAFPVLYTINIATKTAVMERTISERAWNYQGDKHLEAIASVCGVEEREGSLWYKTVFPIKAKVTFCEYVPKAGLEEYVEIAEINIVNR